MESLQSTLPDTICKIFIVGQPNKIHRLIDSSDKSASDNRRKILSLPQQKNTILYVAKHGESALNYIFVQTSFHLKHQSASRSRSQPTIRPGKLWKATIITFCKKKGFINNKRNLQPYSRIVANPCAVLWVKTVSRSAVRERKDGEVPRGSRDSSISDGDESSIAGSRFSFPFHLRFFSLSSRSRTLTETHFHVIRVRSFAEISIICKCRPSFRSTGLGALLLTPRSLSLSISLSHILLRSWPIWTFNSHREFHRRR